MLFPESGGVARTRSRQLAVSHAVTAILILPFPLQIWENFGDFRPLALTRFQPTWYGAGALGLAIASGAWRRPGLGQTRPRRILSLAALLVLAVFLTFWTIPESAAILDRSGDWFTNDVEFLANIAELTPLFASGNQPGWRVPFQLFSPLIMLLPLALIAIVYRIQRPERCVLFFWTAAFLALTLNQTRFINTFSVGHAIVWGGAISRLLDWVRNHLPTRRARVGLQSLIAAGRVMILIVSSWSYYERRLRDGGSAIIDAKRPARRAVADWLANSSPSAHDPTGNPKWGLLCEWSGGHELR